MTADKILAIDSNWDPITTAGYLCREKVVYPHFEAQGYEIIKRQGYYAQRYLVEQDLRMDQGNQEIKYITGIGHGSPNMFTGNHGNIIFHAGTYEPHEVKDRVVHLLSCLTARELGPDMVNNGCTAFFGYDQNFTISDLRYYDLFIECDSVIDIEFANGRKASEVADETVKRFKDTIRIFRDNYQWYAAATLESDLRAFRSPKDGPKWGSLNASII